MIFLIFVSVWPGLGLAAQPAAEPSRSIEFWAYRVGNGNWRDIKFESGDGEVATLRLGKYIKGPIHDYQGPSQLKFFREISAPTATIPQNLARRTIARVVIPSGLDEGILVFTANKVNPGSGREFQVYLIDAGPRDFPANSLRVFNATEVRLAGKVGRETLYFGAGASRAFNLSPFMAEGIPVAFLVETRQGSRFVYEKDLQYKENRRVILLLEPPRRRGSYKIRATSLIEILETE